MLADLFPKEQREADAVLAHDQEREHKRRAHERLREIDLTFGSKYEFVY